MEQISDNAFNSKLSFIIDHIDMVARELHELEYYASGKECDTIVPTTQIIRETTDLIQTLYRD